MAQRWNNDWFPLPGHAVFDRDEQDVTVVSRADGILDLFVIGFDNRVWSTFWTAGGGWNGDWFPLPGQAVFNRATQKVAAITRAGGNLELFVIGFDNRVWATFFNDGVGWNGDWFPLPGQAVFDRDLQQVTAVSRTEGVMDLFVIGFDNRVWSTFWTAGGGWNGDWFPLPGQAVFNRATQKVAAITRAGSNLELFIIGFDNRVWATFFNDGTGWNGDWFPLPGQAVFDRDLQQVTAVSRTEGVMDLFVIGFDNRVWSTFWTADGGWNGDWFPLPGQAVFDRATQKVAAISRAGGNLELFVIGFDNRVWVTFFNDGAGWNRDWFPLPGKAVFDRAVQQVAAVSRAEGNMDLYVVGFDNHVWSTYWAEHPNDRPWAVILCRFKGEAPDAGREDPVARSFREWFTPGSGGLVEFWQEVSLGSVDVTGSRVIDWVEVDIARVDAGGIGRGKLIEAAIRAAKRSGNDPETGFHSQIAVYTRNFSKDGAPPGADWRDPVWGPFWIDGSASGRQVCLTPPFNGNITAHEMGHGFDMGHDVGPGLTTASDYSDPACIMSQNGAMLKEPWDVAFGPALCVPHLVQKGWFSPRRLYVDDGAWMSVGATVPLAPVTSPGARANLGIRLRNVRADPAWDYYLEYCLPTSWNSGVPGAPYLLVRRMVDIPGAGERPAYLIAIPFDQTVGAGATAVEPSGNVRFTVEVTRLPGPILRVVAEAL